jgi:hypothetical protein
MATLNDMTPDAKRTSLGAAKNSLETQIIMALIQMGFEDPFSVDINTTDFSEHEAGLVMAIDRCRAPYDNVCALLTELE